MTLDARNSPTTPWARNDARLRDEANAPLGEIPVREADQEHPDHRDLRQGRHRQVLHARQPQPHDGRARQARAADRLRPEVRHHLAALRRQGLPDDHRDLVAQASSRARRSRSATSASSATASSPWSSAGPKSAAAAAGAASSTASSCWRSSASTTGTSTTSCSTSSATWSAAASACRSPATCAQKVIVVGSQRPAVALRRQQRLLGGRVLPQDGRQRRRRRHRDQQDDGTGEAARLRRGGRHPDPRHDPGGRRHPPQVRELPDRRHRRRASGARCSPNWPRTSRARSPNRPKTLTQDGLLGLFSAKDTGGDVTLEPATDADMRGKTTPPKPSLEVVYDNV